MSSCQVVDVWLNTKQG